mmetsp:Transcript_28156/g.82968  ORF Transcript_28156/g.82968 Transcript_28156/m.82968 type:complete len:245 (-) Transcript_28156:1513-2247(-)
METKTMPFSGLPRNILSALLSVVYVKAVIGGCDYLVSKRTVDSSTSRKIVHVAAASFVLFWPLFDAESDGWSWRLNVLVPAVLSVQLFVKGAILRNPNDEDVRSMSRTGDPKELLYGPLQFTLVMNTVGTILFMEPVSCLIMGAVGVGDGVAPIIGAKCGKHRYRHGVGGTKSIEGSLAMLAGTIGGYYFYSWALDTPVLSVPFVVLGAVVAAAVEGLSPPDADNVLIPIAMYFLHEFYLRYQY